MLTPRILCIVLSVYLAAAGFAGTFGTVVPIGGHASDIALDERRGVLYVANFAANRIEVMSTADNTLQAPMKVAPQPTSLALSPDARYLVVGHLDGSATVLDLDGQVQQNLAVESRVLAAAFGGGSQALLVTEEGFELLDPVTKTLRSLLPEPLTAQGLPVPFATFPPEIIQASVNTSGDKRYVVGLAESGAGSVSFRYDVFTEQLVIITLMASPPLGPRVVSVSQDGSFFLLGWGLFDARGVVIAQFPAPDGAFNIGSHAYDSSRALIYAQIPEGTGTSTPPEEPDTPPETPAPAVAAPPVLHIVDSDNLTVRERLRLPENLAGKALLSSDNQTMYSASDSGVLILPVGSLSQTRRVVALQEDVVFRGNFCDRKIITQDIDIIDPGGGNTDFSLSTTTAGIAISPSSGVTPARVQVRVDPNVFQNQKGTVTAFIDINSTGGVNLPLPVRVLINSREPEQRGAFFDAPGKLVDVLADPARNRFYVIRQDKNQVLVYDGTSFNLVATFRTGNTPVQAAITRDLRYLIVGNDNSQIANVYDLDTLQPSDPIIFPFGHYPHSIAVSNQAMLASVRGVSPLDCGDAAGGPHTIDRIDFNTRTASTPCSLGIYVNSVTDDTVLAASPSGEFIFGAMPDGTVLLYDASADTFVASRKDFASLSGAYAAVNDQTFLVENHLLNRSLVPMADLEILTGASSGFAALDGLGLRTTSPSSSSAGVIQRVDLLRAETIVPIKMAESPLLSESLVTEPIGQIGQSIFPFTRTLAPLANRTSIISLTTSGFTVLPWQFDAAMATPVLERAANLADGSPAIAPGGLISLFGSELSSVTVSSSGLPVPTTLGEACLTVNGVLAPLFLASPGQINAQLPFEVSGNATAVLRAPGGTSNSLQFPVLDSAPAVFHTGRAGPDTGLPTILRAANNDLVTLSNPIHRGDIILIFATGLGRTAPAVETGAGAPFDPLAVAVIQPGITLGGVPLGIEFAGLVPGIVGVYQINASVPISVPTGMEIPLVILSPQQNVESSLNVRVVK